MTVNNSIPAMRTNKKHVTGNSKKTAVHVGF